MIKCVALLDIARSSFVLHYFNVLLFELEIQKFIYTDSLSS